MPITLQSVNQKAFNLIITNQFLTSHYSFISVCVSPLPTVAFCVSSLPSDFGELGFDVLGFSLEELFDFTDESSFVEDLLLWLDEEDLLLLLQDSINLDVPTNTKYALIPMAINRNDSAKWNEVSTQDCIALRRGLSHFSLKLSVNMCSTLRVSN